MRLSVEQIVEATRGRLLQKKKDAFEGYGIDSRTIPDQGLFFAIPGSQTDGHRYVADAWRNGAAGAVLQKDVPEVPITLIQVADSLKALHSLAGYVRNSSRSKFIGITGSSGKTSTKEYTAVLLAQKYRIFRSEGNLNSTTGLPLSLLSTANEECSVFELGMNQPGEIAELAQLLRPHIVMILNVNPVHLSQLESLEAIADEKASIVKGLPEDGSIIYNADDERLRARISKLKQQVVSFGFSEHANLQIIDVISHGVKGSEAAFYWRNQTIRFQTSLCGLGNIQNIAAAVCACLVLNLHWNEIVEGIAKLQPFTQRGVFNRTGEIDFYDDSYNSNPRAMDVALKIVAESEGYVRKVCILGDMLELGKDEVKFHAIVGEQVAANRIDVLITAGPLSKNTAEKARQLGVSHVYETKDAPEAANVALEVLKPGDLVLLKGSRGMKMEAVLNELKQQTNQETPK